MNKEVRLRKRRDLLQGIDKRILQRAAQEIDAKGKLNARMVEVDAKTDWGTRTTELYYIEEQVSDGSWRGYSLEDVAGQGCLDVRRADRQNLEPALRWDLAGRLVRGGVFNEPRPAIEYVRDHVTFRCAGTMSGKVQ